MHQQEVDDVGPELTGGTGRRCARGFVHVPGDLLLHGSTCLSVACDPRCAKMQFPWDSDRWRRHQARDYGEGKTLDAEREGEATEEQPREPRWTKPIAMASFVAIAAVSVLLWVAGIRGLSILLFIVGGGSALLIAGTARPDPGAITLGCAKVRLCTPEAVSSASSRPRSPRVPARPAFEHPGTSSGSR
jgi:hypothetical protein